MTSNSDWYSWDEATVVERLNGRVRQNVVDILKNHSVNGKKLPSLTNKKLKEWGLGNKEDRLQVIQFIKDTCENRKVFRDPIHGYIDLHPLCVKIIDTPHFQRLRAIKQLGGCYYVYPGASHNRFEHSIGVCHLAGQFLRAIQRRQPSLEITEKDILCVEIAGLCHDLGQGPLSRMFDKKFNPEIRLGQAKWEHGDVSKQMFSDMLQANNLGEYFDTFGLNKEDIDFIKDMLAVPTENIQRERKRFLYEIVANTRNGIDVDKWDYIARDCQMLGIKSSFDHLRCIQYARVISVDGELQICYKDKEARNLYEMFHTRWILHHDAYQHRVTNIIEFMITEAMVKANDVLKFKDREGHLVKMSDAVGNMSAYIKLTDKVIDQILDFSQPEPANANLDEAKEILQKVIRRQLYTFVGQTNIKNGKIRDEALIRNMKTDIENKIDDQNLKDAIVILPAIMDYGMYDQNPIDEVRFYRKSQPDVGLPISKERVSWTLPDKFAEQIIRIHSKASDEHSINMIRQAFIEVCREKNYPEPEGREDLHRPDHQ